MPPEAQTASAGEAVLRDNLDATIRRVLPGASGIANLRRLSGGRGQETWSFEAVGRTVARKLICAVRRAAEPNPKTAAVWNQSAAHRSRKDAPACGTAGDPCGCGREDGVAKGFVLGFGRGETLGRKIVRDDTFAEARRHWRFSAGDDGENPSPAARGATRSCARERTRPAGMSCTRAYRPEANGPAGVCARVRMAARPSAAVPPEAAAGARRFSQWTLSSAPDGLPGGARLGTPRISAIRVEDLGADLHCALRFGVSVRPAVRQL